MKTIDEIIKALRCTSTPNPEDDCSNCPYRELNEVCDGIPIKEDAIIDGKKYWQDCDIDQIVIDAADLLEKIQQNMEADTNFLKRKEEEAEEDAETEEEPVLKGYYTGRADAFYTALMLAVKPQEKLNAALKEREEG